MIYRNHRIDPIRPPGPTDIRWEWIIDEYGGPGDTRCGYGISIEDCVRQIDEQILDEDTAADIAIEETRLGIDPKSIHEQLERDAANEGRGV